MMNIVNIVLSLASVHSFTLTAFVEYLPHARLCAKYWGSQEEIYSPYPLVSGQLPRNA